MDNQERPPASGYPAPSPPPSGFPPPPAGFPPPAGATPGHPGQPGASGYPGQPGASGYPGQPPWPGYPGRPPAPRPAGPTGWSVKRWLALAAGAAVLLLVAVVSLISFVANRAVNSGTGLTLPPSATPGEYVDPGQKLEDMLTAQGEALVRGDEQGWLAPLDPDNKKLRDSYRSQFTTLRALRVSAWQAKPVVRPRLKLGQETRTRVTVAYCLAVPKCPPAKLVAPEAAQLTQEVTVRWGPDEQTIVITGSRADEQDRYAARPLPWEAPGLTVREGRRVIVAAPPSQAKRLAGAVAAGDRAASVVDRYARLARRAVPDRYIVFLAGPKEWSTWRGGRVPGWAIGYAYPAGNTPSNVVLRMDDMTSDDLLSTMRHEFGHSITVPGVDDVLSGSHQWLKEGIAEYIQHSGKAAPNVDTRPVRAYLNSDKWPGGIALPSLRDEASPTEVDTFYQVSHLAMRCVAARHGEAKLFRWWFEMVKEGSLKYDEATREHLGVSWAALDRACVSYIRRAAG